MMLLSVLAVAPAAAADYEDCELDDDVEQYRTCLADSVTHDQVLDWTQEDPDDLSQKQIDAVYAVPLDGFSDEEMEQVSNWMVEEKTGVDPSEVNFNNDSLDGLRNRLDDAGSVEDARNRVDGWVDTHTETGHEEDGETTVESDENVADGSEDDTSSEATETAVEEVSGNGVDWDSSVIYEVGTLRVIEEDWSEGYIVIEADRSQEITLAKKSSITSTTGTYEEISIDSDETLRIDLDEASWYSISSSGEFRERTSSLTLRLFQTAATWSFVLRTFLVTLVGMSGLMYYIHWRKERKRNKGARSELSGEYIENIPAHTSDKADDDDADEAGESE